MLYRMEGKSTMSVEVGGMQLVDGLQDLAIEPQVFSLSDPYLLPVLALLCFFFQGNAEKIYSVVRES